MTHDMIDQRISAKRAALRALKEEEAKLREELAALFREKAQVACPIPLGTKIQYKDGNRGVVTRIGFFVDFGHVLEESTDVHWTVEGARIDKGGEAGVREFPPLGPATHTFNGTAFKPKSLGGIWGINEEET
jgi:hypothetical protein